VSLCKVIVFISLFLTLLASRKFSITCEVLGSDKGSYYHWETRVSQRHLQLNKSDHSIPRLNALWHHCYRLPSPCLHHLLIHQSAAFCTTTKLYNPRSKCNKSSIGINLTTHNPHYHTISVSYLQYRSSTYNTNLEVKRLASRILKIE
jgi:hypothetical protein